MAKRLGRGFATIEYPTGMNQNGDPSQAWIKLKPDGRVDVFSGTVDIGQGSKTVHTQIVADALGVPYDWVTMDNTNTDSSAVLQAAEKAGKYASTMRSGEVWRRSASSGALGVRPSVPASGSSTSRRKSSRSTLQTSRSRTAR